MLSGVLSEETILDLGSALFTLVALGYTAGAAGYPLSPGWWDSVPATSAVLSSLLYVALRDGRTEKLMEKGEVGIVINVVVLVWLYAQI